MFVSLVKGPQVYLSRSHPGLVKRLFELEVPEIQDGVVEIKSISREAGSRTKMAVYTADENVDPVGACVGTRGTRVQTIVDELFGEKIDIINWSDNPEKLISSALSPAKVELLFRITSFLLRSEKKGRMLDWLQSSAAGRLILRAIPSSSQTAVDSRNLKISKKKEMLSLRRFPLMTSMKFLKWRNPRRKLRNRSKRKRRPLRKNNSSEIRGCFYESKKDSHAKMCRLHGIKTKA